MTYPTTTYNRSQCAVFLKTDEQYGSLSNMCGGFPLIVNRLRIHTSEHLYQALRFPLNPQAQMAVLTPPSPMAAKMKSKPFRKTVNRPDWDDVCVDIMRWCLNVKLVWNWPKFTMALNETGQLPIVEQSAKDPMWGALVDNNDDNILVGQNVLGHLLMEMRATLASDPDSLEVVQPLDIADFMLNGKAIGVIERPNRRGRQADKLYGL